MCVCVIEILLSWQCYIHMYCMVEYTPMYQSMLSKWYIAQVCKVTVFRTLLASVGTQCLVQLTGCLHVSFCSLLTNGWK